MKQDFVTRLTRWLPQVEQELLTLPEYLSLPPVFKRVHVTTSGAGTAYPSRVPEFTPGF